MADDNTTIVSIDAPGVGQRREVILDDVKLKIDRGEFVYLIGKTGSGKSTLLRVLYGDLPLRTGEGYVAGFNLRELDEDDIPYLRRRLGIVFQDFQLLQDRSAAANLRFVLKATGWKSKGEIEDRIEEVMKAVGMENKAYKMPHELSGGEQQRVVIARALLNSPRLILADEPTGNLDPQTGYQIVDLLHRLSDQGTGVIMATHNMQMVEDFPARVLRCENKSLI